MWFIEYIISLKSNKYLQLSRATKQQKYRDGFHIDPVADDILFFTIHHLHGRFLVGDGVTTHAHISFPVHICWQNHPFHLSDSTTERTSALGKDSRTPLPANLPGKFFPSDSGELPSQPIQSPHTDARLFAGHGRMEGRRILCVPGRQHCRVSHISSRLQRGFERDPSLLKDKGDNHYGERYVLPS